MIYFYYDNSSYSGIGHNLLNITYYHNLCLKYNAKFILLDICYFSSTLSTESDLFLKYFNIKSTNVITNRDEYDKLCFEKTDIKENIDDKMCVDVYTNNTGDMMYWITNEWNNNICVCLQDPVTFYNNGIIAFSEYFQNEMRDKYGQYFNMITCHIRHGNGELADDRRDFQDRRLFQAIIDMFNNILNTHYKYSNLDKSTNKLLIISDNTDVHKLFTNFDVVQCKDITTNLIHSDIKENQEEHLYECLKDIYLMSKSSILLRKRSAFSLCPVIFNPHIHFL